MAFALSAGASLLGTTGASAAVNFVIRSRSASAMALVLARKPATAEAAGRKPGGCLEIALDPFLNRTGDLWHVAVQVCTRMHACFGFQSPLSCDTLHAGHFLVAVACSLGFLNLQRACEVTGNTREQRQEFPCACRA